MPPCYIKKGSQLEPVTFKGATSKPPIFKPTKRRSVVEPFEMRLRHKDLFGGKLNRLNHSQMQYLGLGGMKKSYWDESKEQWIGAKLTKRGFDRLLELGRDPKSLFRGETVTIRFVRR